MTTTRKNVAIFFLVFIVSMMVLAFASPLTAYADTTNTTTNNTKTNDPNAVNVSIDENGNLIVNMGGFNQDGKGVAGAWNMFIEKYKKFITGFAGIGAVTMIVFFIIAFLRLGASVGNPNARSQALTACLWTGIAAALLGSVTFITGFVYNAFG